MEKSRKRTRRELRYAQRFARKQGRECYSTIPLPRNEQTPCVVLPKSDARMHALCGGDASQYLLPTVASTQTLMYINRRAREWTEAERPLYPWQKKHRAVRYIRRLLMTYCIPEDDPISEYYGVRPPVSFTYQRRLLSRNMKRLGVTVEDVLEHLNEFTEIECSKGSGGYGAQPPASYQHFLLSEIFDTDYFTGE